MFSLWGKWRLMHLNYPYNLWAILLNVAAWAAFKSSPVSRCVSASQTGRARYKQTPSPNPVMCILSLTSPPTERESIFLTERSHRLCPAHLFQADWSSRWRGFIWISVGRCCVRWLRIGFQYFRKHWIGENRSDPQVRLEGLYWVRKRIKRASWCDGVPGK